MIGKFAGAIIWVMKERQPVKKASVGIVIEQDPEEREFSHLIDAWIKKEISDVTLKRNIPSHELTLSQRILRFVLDRTL